MEKKMRNFFLRLTLIITAILPFIVGAASIDFKEVTIADLTKKYQPWFIKEFPKGFMAVYHDKTFVITKEGKPTILGPTNTKDKQVWLLETAKEEFQDYVLTPKEGYKAILIEYQKQPIGSLLYRMLENEKTIYLAQYFIDPEFQKKGIGVHLLLNILPALHPDYKRYEILARHQNDAAFLLYKKAGFSIGDEAMVKKYDYDPLRYMSFYKDR